MSSSKIGIGSEMYERIIAYRGGAFSFLDKRDKNPRPDRAEIPELVQIGDKILAVSMVAVSGTADGPLAEMIDLAKTTGLTQIGSFSGFIAVVDRNTELDTAKNFLSQNFTSAKEAVDAFYAVPESPGAVNAPQANGMAPRP